MKTSYTVLHRGEVGGVGTIYGLTESSVTVEGDEYVRYGAFIERDDGERAEALDFCGDREGAGKLARRLFRGSVTPAAFMDIVSDELYAREFK